MRVAFKFELAGVGNSLLTQENPRTTSFVKNSLLPVARFDSNDSRASLQANRPFLTNDVSSCSSVLVPYPVYPAHPEKFSFAPLRLCTFASLR